MTGLRILLGAVILGGLAAAAPFTPLWLISLVTLAMSTGLVVCGLIILWRGGLVPFGQALFFATGAYTVALSGRWFGVTDAFLLIALAVIMAALVAFVVGFLLAQYREIFFAMLSLALSMILYGVLVKSETLGSTDGINVGPGQLFRHEAARSRLHLRIVLAGARHGVLRLGRRLGLSRVGCRPARRGDPRQ